ncbi:MAG: hypothetical protein CMO34_04345 [Verrucomicrobia bacterium]|nr:hypothetical protein [Verrucomicrobiota bacterium]|tara:strand:+ start:392 stop:721 length:330 start_codon:yes stop_codon:yes gene_type:complete
MWTKINFQEHPTNIRKKVFFFEEEEHARHFEDLLQKESIRFEKQIDHQEDRKIYFGVSLADFEKVKKLNYITIGKYRQKFIPDTALRWFVIGISILVLIMALIGLLLST